MKILLTRPLEQAAIICEKLEKDGHQVDVAPMMHIDFLPPEDIPAYDSAGMIFTSINGVKAAENLVFDKTGPAFCVGTATADAAKSAGFSDVRTAGGNADSLYDLIRAEHRPQDRSLCHIAGIHVAGNLAEKLNKAGYPVTRITAYEAKPITKLAPEIAGKIREAAYDAVLFYSPRTAAIFVETANREGLGDCFTEMAALCLSAAVARELSGLTWQRIVLAKSPGDRHFSGALQEMVK